MSNNNQSKSEVAKAAQTADSSKLQENLDVKDESNHAKDLDQDQAPPFIDESVRTDQK